MAAVFLLAGVPVYRLTRPAAGEAVAAATPATAVAGTSAKPVPLEVEVVFAPAPADFQLKNLDQTVCEGHGPQARFTARWTVAVPAEGMDLVVQARWQEPSAGTAPESGLAAARITVRFPDGHATEKSFWAAANGSLDDVFTVLGTP